MCGYRNRLCFVLAPQHFAVRLDLDHRGALLLLLMLAMLPAFLALLPCSVLPLLPLPRPVVAVVTYRWFDVIVFYGSFDIVVHGCVAVVAAYRYFGIAVVFGRCFAVVVFVFRCSR